MSHAATDWRVLGVDIGGTKVAVGVVDRAGKILEEARKPMVANGTAEQGLKAVTDAIDTFVSPGSGIRAIGILSPGPLDPRSGVVLNPPNLPCWRNFPLTETIAARYKIPVRVDNDANAAGLAETKWGAARGYRYVFYATIGTGIGTGIVLDGQIYEGKTGSAGEGGHVSIDYRGPRCHCGKLGCIEILAAGPAIGVRARAKVAAETAQHSSRAQALLALANGDAAAVTSEHVGKAFAAGDELAREILEETVALLTVWLGNMVDVLDPDVIVIGGGVAAMLEPFFGEIKKRLPEWCVNPHVAAIPLLLARYGAEAGIAGGAALCAE